MKRSLKRSFLAGACLALLAFAAPVAADMPAGHPGHYKNFDVAVYVTVDATKRMADPATQEREFDRVMSQVKFDKVYIEDYRDGQFASDAQVAAAKKFFESKGIAVSGGITLAAGQRGGQFVTFDYEDPADRATAERAVREAARHFNQVVLDDFFFYNTKSEADIKAKGTRSWTQYRLEKMRKVARNLVLEPAKQVNPKIQMIIKYPNWYEHFQGLGFDLDKEAQMFGGIYTGTETRDPDITDQLLQQYESYEIIRYYDNIRPDGGNHGGWVDTFDTRYADRYAEQLWDTMFAKAPEITLFSWDQVADEKAIPPGARPWKDQRTSFDWNAMVKDYKGGGEGPGWASVAGAALRSVDKVVGELGHPIGIASYKPYQSSGEDFLQNYLGNVGIPIEMTPHFPTKADIVLLTQEAAGDRDLVPKIKAQLMAGKTVVITSGLLRALQDRGIQSIAEWWDTGNVAAIRTYFNGYGAGSGNRLDNPAQDNPAVLFPEIHFYTNDSWPIIRGVARDKGFPIMLMNRYAKGTLYLLNIPENMGDLYSLPEGVLTQIKKYLQADFPVRIDAPAKVALFAYDNNTFVVESYLPTDAKVDISIAGKGRHVRDLTGDAALQAVQVKTKADPAVRHRYTAPPRTDFPVTIAPHSYRVFKIEN
jgi:hypothetical protein